MPEIPVWAIFLVAFLAVSLLVLIKGLDMPKNFHKREAERDAIRRQRIQDADEAANDPEL